MKLAISISGVGALDIGPLLFIRRLENNLSMHLDIRKEFLAGVLGLSEFGMCKKCTFDVVHTIILN